MACWIPGPRNLCWPAKPEQFAKWKNGQIVEPEPEKEEPKRRRRAQGGSKAQSAESD
jgi:hypothetical protein